MKEEKISETSNIKEKYQSTLDMAKDVKSALHIDTSSKSVPNRIVLAGFMEFNELANHLTGESNANFSDMLKDTQRDWKKKRDYMNKLPAIDPYIIPTDIVVDIDDNLSNHCKEIAEKIKFYSPYHELPFELKMVRIDYLIALQNQVNLERVRDVDSRMKKDMDTKDLVDFCINTNNFEIPLKKQIISSGITGFATFTTGNDDVRIRGVDYRDVYIHEENGVPLTDVKSKALTMMFGLGDPFVIVYRIPITIQNGSQIEQRSILILNNGFHRAYALKKAGYSHMPCVLSDLTQDQIPTYLGSWQNRLGLINLPRPPIFKDFFNTELTMPVTAPSRRRYIKITWNAEILPIFD